MFTSRIQKGGALLAESRVLVEEWDLSLTPGSNLDNLEDRNVFAKRSISRTHDILREVLRPRFVEPGPQVIPALRPLAPHPRPFAEACYFEAARADALLAALGEGPLWAWYQAGRIDVQTEDVLEWLGGLHHRGAVPDWSTSVSERVAQGLLAAVRDFGVLTGVTRKRFASPRLTPAGFAYVAFRLHEGGATARGLVNSAVWRRWLLGPDDVVQLLAELAHLGILRHSRAGSVARLDWEMDSLLEVARAVA